MALKILSLKYFEQCLSKQSLPPACVQIFRLVFTCFDLHVLRAVHSFGAKVKVHGLHIIYFVLCHYCMQFENRATTTSVRSLWNFDIRGQGYDGAANMSSSRVVVQARIREDSLSPGVYCYFNVITVILHILMLLPPQ